MSKPFDPTKPVQCLNGYAAKIYEVYDDKIHGALYKDGDWIQVSWLPGGKKYAFGDSGLDLVNIPEKFTGYLHIHRYTGGGHFGYFSVHNEKYESTNPVIARIKVTFEEGQFDE